MSRLGVAALLVARFGLLGCGACRGEPTADPGDAQPDAERAADGDLDVDADADDEDGRDGGEGDAEPDDGGLPPPRTMEVVEVPVEREGLDCGPGCRQLSFAEPVQLLYNADDSYVVYISEAYNPSLYMIELETGTEYRFLYCDEESCGLPVVNGSTIVFVTANRHDTSLKSIWRYQVGSDTSYPIIQRRVTEIGRPVTGLDLSGTLVAWYDSSVSPAGLYAMDVEGGPVIDLTPLKCLCYGDPELWSRQVVYEGWQTLSHEIYLVDIDTLATENLTRSVAPQFEPAFDGAWVVWTDGRNDPTSDPYGTRYNSDIYGMEMATGVEEALCNNPATQLHPDVRDGLVVWEDFRNADDPNGAWVYRANTDIYLLDLATRREVQVTSLPGAELLPRVVGTKVFYVAEDLLGQDSIFVVDLIEAGLLER